MDNIREVNIHNKQKKSDSSADAAKRLQRTDKGMGDRIWMELA